MYHPHKHECMSLSPFPNQAFPALLPPFSDAQRFPKTSLEDLGAILPWNAAAPDPQPMLG